MDRESSSRLVMDGATEAPTQQNRFSRHVRESRGCYPGAVDKNPPHEELRWRGKPRIR